MMTRIFHDKHHLLFLLLFMMTACEGPTKEKCDTKCKECLVSCVEQCQASYNYCLHSGKGAYENCSFYGSQCTLYCPEKCKDSKEKTGER